MKGATIARRRARSLELGLAAVNDGMSFGDAAAKYRLAKTTLWEYARKDGSVNTHSKRFALTKEEEEVILNTILRFADRGIPLNRDHVREAVHITVETFPADRRAKLPFKDSYPGKKWLASFYKRHKDKLKYTVPCPQEADRYAAVNANTLTSHFAQLEELISQYELDRYRVWNLDETGTTPGRDSNGATKERKFVRRQKGSDFKTASFKNTHRVTVMPCVNAGGEIGPTLYVFKGQKMPYREVVVGGKLVVETFATHLPRNSVVTMREKVAGVDSNSFFQWAEMFCKFVEPQTAGGRKVLLTYDGYRSHLSLRVLEMFQKNNIIVYSLPAHTSGKTQPCDMNLFRTYKRNIDKVIAEAASVYDIDTYDAYDFCRILREAYQRSFTAQIIQMSFRESGLWPLNPYVLLSVPRPRDNDDVGTLISVEKLETELARKRTIARELILGKHLEMTRSGFLDTSRGAVVTAKAAMDKARSKARLDRITKAEKELAIEKKEYRRLKKKDKIAGKPDNQVRSRKLRRAHARVRVKEQEVRALKQ